VNKTLRALVRLTATGPRHVGDRRFALIQAILRHSNIGITQNIYIKSVTELRVSAMDSLSEKLELCNVRATETKGPVN
jgi:hypothetical protein